MAEPARELEQAPAPQEAPKQDAPASLNEALAGQPSPETPETLREHEARKAEEGMAKLNEMGKNMNLEAEHGAQEFKQSTESWWGRVKGFFKKEKAPAQDESAIMLELEKSNAVYAEFKRKYDEILASGDEKGLKAIERDLSQTFDVLAKEVAAEGASDGKAMRKALKTGEVPMSETGAKLNDVTRRLQEVRSRLGGGSAPEAPSEEAPETPAQEPAAAAKAEKAPDDPDRAKLLASFKGTPVEGMVDAYLKEKNAVGTSDRFGEIVGAGIGMRRLGGVDQATVTTRYADGTERVLTSSGRELAILPGGLMKDVEAATPAEAPKQAEEGPGEEIFNEAEKAELNAGAEKLREEMRDKRMMEGVVSGETEAKEPPAEKPAEASVVVEAPPAPVIKTSEMAPTAAGEIETPTKLVTMKTSEDAPTASGEIGGEHEVEEDMIEKEEPANAPEPPKSPREVYPDLPTPAPGSRPPGVPETAPSAPTPETPPQAPEPEKKEHAEDKIEGAMDKVAKALIASTDAPKTLGSKVGRMPADEFLTMFEQASAVTAAEASELKERFKTDPEEFDALRKKLAQAVKKAVRG